jgi:hypothetical protein
MTVPLVQGLEAEEGVERVRPQRVGGPSLDDIRLLIARIGEEMKAHGESFAEESVEARLPNLRITAGKIGSSLPRRPPPLKRYMVRWKEFESGKSATLDRGTVRYLCWEPDTATGAQFLHYVRDSSVELSVRDLWGLVRSCHFTWGGPFLDSPSLAVVRDLLSRYDRPSPIIEKWKTNIDAVIGPQGPAIMSAVLVAERKDLRAFLEEWYLDTRSPFVRRIVEAAAARCRDQLAQPSRGLLKLLFAELLQWPGWENLAFKQEVGALILHGSACVQTREILQKFILLHKDLGDPRLPANTEKWTGFPEKAREMVLQWLKKYPLSSLERVYREEKGWFWRSLGEGDDDL